MRKPDLSKHAIVNGQPYTTKQLILELMGKDWSQDEASVASFSRIAEALAKEPFVLAENDFERLCKLIKELQFQPILAIELGMLRNAFVFTPKEEEV
jgi:hypothetical protein